MFKKSKLLVEEYKVQNFIGLIARWLRGVERSDGFESERLLDVHRLLQSLVSADEISRRFCDAKRQELTTGGVACPRGGLKAFQRRVLLLLLAHTKLLNLLAIRKSN